MIISLYAGLLALVYIGLSVNIITTRYKLRSALGDEGDFELKRKIRAHANFIEYTPLFLVLMGFAEVGGFADFYVNIISAIFLFGRVSHAYSILKGEKYKDGKIQGYPLWRSVGMVSTFLCIITVAFVLIGQRV